MIPIVKKEQGQNPFILSPMLGSMRVLDKFMCWINSSTHNQSLIYEKQRRPHNFPINTKLDTSLSYKVGAFLRHKGT